jgi:hypothetical protein
MKPDLENFELYKKIKTELVDFLQEQSDRLPDEWDGVDHVMMVLETALSQYKHIGFNKKEIRREVDILLKMGDKKHRLQ